jgi:2-polyprenyl-3-methyl-5-hydroxy-6-metoxy-1,4-benzoquinol methylase
MATPTLDTDRLEAFAGRMVTLLNDAFLALLLSIGHRTELFETLAGIDWATSAEIAERAGLQERYVREWLAGLTVGGIVEHDHEAGRYRLPSEHAALLTRAAGPDNLAYFAQYVPLCGLVEDELIGCFRNGGGVPYSSYPRFQELQAGESAALYDTKLVDLIVPLVPDLPERLAAGIDVLDVGCGQGHAMVVLAKAFPASRFAGYDFAEEGVAAGRAEAASLGLANVRFEARDLATLDEPGRYDLVTAFDVIHDLAKPEAVLAAIRAALRPGGTFLMVDIQASSHLHENLEHPLAPLLYTASTVHCMTVSLSQGGPGLGAMWGEQLALSMLHDAGFSDVEVERLEGDVLHNFYVARP